MWFWRGDWRRVVEAIDGELFLERQRERVGYGVMAG